MQHCGRQPVSPWIDGMIRQELGYGVALGVASAWAMMRMISARISAGSRCQASITAVRSG